MAERFDFSSIFEEEMWTVLYDNAEGYQEKFFNIVKKEIEKSNFPNLEVTTEDFTSGGLFFHKETTKMIKLKAQKSQFKRFEVYFRAQIFGNTVVFTRMECMEKGFLDVFKTGAELYALVRSKCKNLAQYEEFIALDNLADLIFDESMKQLDPIYRERKQLARK